MYSRSTRPRGQLTSTRKFRNGSAIGSRLVTRMNPLVALVSTSSKRSFVSTNARSSPARRNCSSVPMPARSDSSSPDSTPRSGIRACNGSLSPELTSMLPRPKAPATAGVRSAAMLAARAVFRIMGAFVSHPTAARRLRSWGLKTSVAGTCGTPRTSPGDRDGRCRRLHLHKLRARCPSPSRRPFRSGLLPGLGPARRGSPNVRILFMIID